MMMMKKQAFMLFEAAKKAAQAAHQESRCVALLHRMRSTPITTHDILSTAIAGELDHLTDHPNSSIQTAATRLLDDWRRKLYHDGGRTESRTIRTAAPKTKSSTTKIAAQVKNMKRVEGVAPVSKKVDACDRDTVRSKIRSRLVEALSKVVEEVECDETREAAAGCNLIYVAGVLESALFRNLGAFTGANKLKWQSILFNIRDPRNPDFRRKILLGEVEPESVDCMNTEEMASHKRQLENEQIRVRKLSKIGTKVSTVEEEPVLMY